LGIYAAFPVTGSLVGEFLDRIPQRYRLVEMNLNLTNPFVPGIHREWTSSQRKNFLLDLAPDYPVLLQGYKSRTIRNLKKAMDALLVVDRKPDTAEIISLGKKKMKRLTNIGNRHFSRFSKLADYALGLQKARKYGVCSSEGRLLAGAVFFLSPGQVFYLLVGNAREGREVGASHLLIDAFIRDHAGHPLVLDFEGSDLTGLAFFYNGFGAREVSYPFIRRNTLPLPARWLKG